MVCAAVMFLHAVAVQARKLTLYMYHEMTYVEMRCTQNRWSPLLRFVIAVCMQHNHALHNLPTTLFVGYGQSDRECCYSAGLISSVLTLAGMLGIGLVEQCACTCSVWDALTATMSQHCITRVCSIPDY